MYYYIVDCGSTGTRVIQFDKQKKTIIQNKILEFGPIVSLIQFYSEPHKLQKENITKQLLKVYKLNICSFIKLIIKQLKSPSIIYFGCTGGVRKFIKQNNKNKPVIKSFDIFYNCLKELSTKKIQIKFDKYYITSANECAYEYLSCLYLASLFKKPQPTGVIGIGGSSIQISFENGRKCVKIPFSENIGYSQITDQLRYPEKKVESMVIKKLKKQFNKQKLKGVYYGTEALYYTFVLYKLHNKQYKIPQIINIVKDLRTKNPENKVLINLIIIQNLLDICFDETATIIVQVEFGNKSNKLATSWVFGKFVNLITNK